jgi:hypothetical protein
VAVGAANLREPGLAILSGRPSRRIVGDYPPRIVHRRLKDSTSGNVAHRQFIRNSVLIEIIRRDRVAEVIFLSRAKAFHRFHSVVVIECVDRKNSYRVDHSFLVKRLDHQISIYSSYG